MVVEPRAKRIERKFFASSFGLPQGAQSV